MNTNNTEYLFTALATFGNPESFDGYYSVTAEVRATDEEFERNELMEIELTISLPNSYTYQTAVNESLSNEADLETIARARLYAELEAYIDSSIMVEEIETEEV